MFHRASFPLFPLLPLLAAGFLACGSPPFELHITFEGATEVSEGAEVRYEGVVVGRVRATDLRQLEPSQPAQAVVTIELADADLRLRRDDRFEMVPAHGEREAYVRITPAQGDSEPLESGEAVAGVPPLVTRIGASVDEALQALVRIAGDGLDSALDEIARSLEEIEIDSPPEAEEEPGGAP
jgi:ABC-type transporter Mla subunit MlaD